MIKKKNDSITADEEAVEQTYLAKHMKAEGTSETAEPQNIYEHVMSSTETALVSPEDFHKLKLIS
jgi:hypothetical protein